VPRRAGPSCPASRRPFSLGRSLSPAQAQALWHGRFGSKLPKQRNMMADHNARKEGGLPPFDISRLDRISSRATSDGQPPPARDVRRLVLAVLFLIAGAAYFYVHVFRSEVLPYSRILGSEYGLLVIRGYWLAFILSLIHGVLAFDSAKRSLRAVAVLLALLVGLVWLFCEMLILGAQLSL
jgi:hypothetical protein